MNDFVDKQPIFSAHLVLLGTFHFQQRDHGLPPWNLQKEKFIDQTHDSGQSKVKNDKCSQENVDFYWQALREAMYVLLVDIIT